MLVLDFFNKAKRDGGNHDFIFGWATLTVTQLDSRTAFADSMGSFNVIPNDVIFTMNLAPHFSDRINTAAPAYITHLPSGTNFAFPQIFSNRAIDESVLSIKKSSISGDTFRAHIHSLTWNVDQDLIFKLVPATGLYTAFGETIGRTAGPELALNTLALRLQ